MPPKASAAAAGAAEASGSGTVSGQLDGLNVKTVEFLNLDATTVEAVRFAWDAFTSQLGSSDAAGKLVFSTLFESSAQVASVFAGTSKGLAASRFMNGIKGLFGACHEPQELKTVVESLAFQHMAIEVTASQVLSFRFAVIDSLLVTLGEQLTPRAQNGISMIFDYVGGAMIYYRTHYAERIQVIKDSWAAAQAGSKKGAAAAAGNAKKKEEDEGSGMSGSFEVLQRASAEFGKPPSASKAKTSRNVGGKMRGLFRRKKPTPEVDLLDQVNTLGSTHGDDEPDGSKEDVLFGGATSGQAMPQSFEDMFEINAAVMGVRNNELQWMREVIENLDNFVIAVSDSTRFACESDVLTIQISKYPSNSINLNQFRSCMLAALRSLLSKQWTSQHEDAWTWMWDTIAGVLQKNMMNPPLYEKSLEQFFSSMEDEVMYQLRSDNYVRFFELAPASQDYLKQSNTRLHFIMEHVLAMTLDMFQKPSAMVSQISALGLRHVGFGIPTELIPIFVVSLCDVLKTYTEDSQVQEAFAWSLKLVSRILSRTIMEGSTVVMQAINANSQKTLKKAIGAAPRKSRATFLLNVQVGDQHISPLSWAIESGSLGVAKAILADILTIRADRSRYYYGVNELWSRHPDIVKKLQEEAPVLLKPLLDGLIWRSHRTKDGERRVNYYIKPMLVKADGTFADALECISAAGDPSLVSHPTVALLADCLWSGVVVRHFIISRMWNVISLVIFILSQEILPSWNQGETGSDFLSYSIFIMRVWGYVVGMGRLATFHLYKIWLWCRNTMRRIIREIDTDGNGEIDYEEMVEALSKFKDTVINEAKKAIRALREDGPGTMDEAKKAMANREKNMYTMISFSLLLLLGVMCTHEPMFWCSGEEGWPTEYCEATGYPLNPTGLKYRYSIFAMTAMAVHWLILIDLAVFSTEISAFLLVCGHVLGEVKQFLTALSFLLLAFGSSISILCRNCPTDGGNFNDFPNAVISLFAITVGLYQGDFRDIQDSSLLLIMVSTFVTIAVILLLNLLVAQLNRSYEYIYKDMLGFARLNRASLIVDAMESCSRKRFTQFVNSLRFDQRLEFDEGDLGLPGGIALTEDSKLHVQTREAIRRFGGTTSGDAPWPEDKELVKENEEDGEHEKMLRLEKIVTKILKRTNAIASKSARAQSRGEGGPTMSAEMMSSVLNQSSQGHSRSRSDSD